MQMTMLRLWYSPHLKCSRVVGILVLCQVLGLQPLAVLAGRYQSLEGHSSWVRSWMQPDAVSSGLGMSPIPCTCLCSHASAPCVQHLSGCRAD